MPLWPSCSVNSICSSPLSGARENKPDRRLLPRLHLVLLQPSKIELHLTLVRGLESFELEFDHDESTELSVVEEEVNVEVLPIDHQPLLPSDERKTHAEFEDELLHLPEHGCFEVFLAIGVS